MSNKKTQHISLSEKISILIDKVKSQKFIYITGFILIAIGLFLFISLGSFCLSYSTDQSTIEDIAQAVDNGSQIDANEVANKGGRLGVMLGQFFVQDGFGYASFIIPIFIMLVGFRLIKLYKNSIIRAFLNSTLLLFWLSLFLAFTFEPIYKNASIFWGGKVGYNISNWLVIQIGSVGVIILLLTVAMSYSTYVSIDILNWIKNKLNVDFLKKIKLPKTEKKKEKEEDDDDEIDTTLTEQENTQATETVCSQKTNHIESETEQYIDEKSSKYNSEKVEFSFENGIQTDSTKEADIEIVKTVEETIVENTYSGPYDPTNVLADYKYPTLDLMRRFDNDTPTIDMEEQTANKEKIITTLRSFGIEISSIKATVGPTVTLYEITPEQGVRISKIRGLEDDIALSLSADGIRIIAPIPGKGTIGIEVPNRNPKIVSGQSVIGSKKFQESKFDLPVVLGKTITNEVFMFDLCKMPHVLVAGATGQGKSVGLNAIITSLLYKKHPAELKFVLVDPKKVEFSIYSVIENHFLAKLPNEEEPIITDVKKVVQTLNSVCIEMDTRYDLLKAAQVRNVKEYNEKFVNHKLREDEGHRYMPYIVVIIDEFGDLIMTAGKEVELPIARIAQLARAVGIHMIIATQRPTTNIITGTIKANFPARIAFRVSAMMDSRTILDRPGANRLIGKGDMLFLQGADPVRVQCAFIDTPEVEEITKYISEQRSFPTPHYLPEYVGEDDEAGTSRELNRNEVDPLFADAARLVVANQLGSTSLLQRKMSIGYARAGRLMDQLERAGIVGAGQGSKPREVLYFSEVDLETVLNNYI